MQNVMKYGTLFIVTRGLHSNERGKCATEFFSRWMKRLKYCIKDKFDWVRQSLSIIIAKFQFPFVLSGSIIRLLLLLKFSAYILPNLTPEAQCNVWGAKCIPHFAQFLTHDF